MPLGEVLASEWLRTYEHHPLSQDTGAHRRGPEAKLPRALSTYTRCRASHREMVLSPG